MPMTWSNPSSVHIEINAAGSQSAGGTISCTYVMDAANSINVNTINISWIIIDNVDTYTSYSSVTTDCARIIRHIQESSDYGRSK